MTDLIERLWASAPVAEFWVGGQPSHAGNKLPVTRRRGGKMVMRRTASGRMSPVVDLVDQSRSRGARWREVLKFAARRTGVAIVGNCPIAVRWLFYLERPKLHYRACGKGLKPWAEAAACLKPPDLSKMVRAAEDALTGTLWDDDRLIVATQIEKRWAGLNEGPGVRCAVYCLEDAEDAK